MQIGNIRLGAPVALAPMAGITDMPFRVICKELGCGLVVSEMVSAKGLLYKNVKTFDMLRIAPEERPAAIQLFGSVPQELARAAKIVEADGADIVDFNMGCPVPKIVNNGEGSALMKNPQLAYEILARMADAVKIPVTVKIRAGWDADHVNAPEIAQLAEKAGVAAIAVHGRTREQFYNGKADWSVIKAVKDAVKIPVFGNGDLLSAEPVFGNGDLLSAEDGLRMFKETGCDGLMIGRGADGNPWIFKEIISALNGDAQRFEPSLDERMDMIVRHLKMLIAFKGEVIAVKEMRRHAGAYLKGMPMAAEYRRRINALNTFDEFKLLAEEYRTEAGKFLAAKKQFLEANAEICK